MDSAKRQRIIAQINAKEKAPSAEDLRCLKEHGCESWGEYVVNQAEEQGVSISNAYSLFSLLGPSEAFDGFVTELEDAAMMAEDG